MGNTNTGDPAAAPVPVAPAAPADPTLGSDWRSFGVLLRTQVLYEADFDDIPDQKARDDMVSRTELLYKDELSLS